MFGPRASKWDFRLATHSIGHVHVTHLFRLSNFDYSLHLLNSPEAEKKIEEAYKASDDGYVETDEDKVANAMFAKAAETGDYTYLEEKWEVFVEKATRPGEDDDDDDEDDEDEDEDDEDEDEDE